jgi:hypothetical protein
MDAHFRELLEARNTDNEMMNNLVNQYPDTLQLKESLLYERHEVPIECEPLKTYLSQHGSTPRFIDTLRANKRGYLGKWAVIRNELYLIELSGMLENKEEITLEDIFPGQERVLAEWFNGEIVLTQGKLLSLKNADRPAIYEKDLHLKFVNGRLADKYCVENTPDEFAGKQYKFLSELKRKQLADIR